MKESWNFHWASFLITLDVLKDEVKKNWVTIMYVAGFAFLFATVVAFFNGVSKIGEDLSKPLPITQSSKLTKVDTEVVKPAAVRVYKPEAKKKLALPAQVQQDATKAVTTAVTVDSSLRPQTVASVLDTATGETTTYVNEEPYPWVALRDSGSASLAYGFKGLNPAPVVRLSVTQDVLQIKAIALGAVAHLDSDGDTFVGAGATYRW